MQKQPVATFNFLQLAQRTLRGNEKASGAHDLFLPSVRLEPDVESKSDDIDVRARAPRCPRVFTVRIAESNMNAWKFLVLENVSDHALYAEICANRKLAHTIRVLVRVRVCPEIRFELLVLAGAGDDAILRNFPIFQER
jgi:hypothetical protein